jgi:hypothetical protein
MNKLDVIRERHERDDQLDWGVCPTRRATSPPRPRLFAGVSFRYGRLN